MMRPIDVIGFTGEPNKTQTGPRKLLNSTFDVDKISGSEAVRYFE